ncbi:hypothetical protein D9M71_150960 [compost metagenome]
MLAVHVGVAGEDLPFFGELAAGRQFDTLNAGFAGVFIAGGIDLNACVVFLGAEDIGSQRQAIVQQVPLGTDFVVLGGFRLHVAVEQVAVTVRSAAQWVDFSAFAQAITRWRRGGGVGGVDAAVFRRLVNDAELTGDEFAGVLAFDGVAIGHDSRTRSRTGAVLGVEMVITQAHVQQPLRRQLQGVEHVDGTGVGIGVDAGVVARDGAAPRIAWRRVRKRGAVVAAWCADHSWCAVGVGCAAWHGIGIDAVRGPLVFFTSKLNTGGEVVLEACDKELTKQIGLVGGGFGIAHTGVGTTPYGTVVDVALAVVRLGQDVVLHAAAVTQGVLDGQCVVQVVLDGDGRGIGTGLAEVAVGQAVEIAGVAAVVRLVRIGLGASCREAGRNGVRNTRIRRVVAFQVVVVEVDAGVGAQAERQGRGDAPAVVVHAFAAGDVAFVAHQVQTASGGVGELVVAIQGVTLGLVRTPGEATVERVAQVRLFAHQVDAAAGCATAADGRVRALADFDRFNGEDFAALGASVTHAVQVRIGLGVEATDERAVALGVAAFTGTEGDAWHSAQCILHVHGTGVLEDLLGNHGDRTRRVHQRRGVFLRGRFVDLVLGVFLLCLAGNASGIQCDCIALVGLICRIGQVWRGGSSDRHADCRGKQAW